jgi:DNA replication and repair protein RecF
MQITHLELENFRNIASARLDPCPGVNVIYGANAQGKTNLLEAIWLCSGNRSFRGARENQMARFGEKIFRVHLTFADREREQKISYDSGGDKRRILLNRMPLRSASELTGEFTCVVFHPEDLSLVKQGPADRRNFLDIAVSQVKPVYGRYLSQYDSVLEQRNALLRQIGKTHNPSLDAAREMLSIWDEQLCKIGTAIAILRQDYIQKLSALAETVYRGFTGDRETFSLCYESSVFPKGVPLQVYSEELIDLYREKLAAHLEDDIRLRFTGVGIHRDDLDIAVNSLSARAYGSQGQQRSCAIALKIGEAMLLKGVTGEDPVILLDDVMSELDPARQDYLLNRIRGFQVFITCCDTANTLRIDGGRIFHVESGRFTQVTKEELLGDADAF